MLKEEPDDQQHTENFLEEKSHLSHYGDFICRTSKLNSVKGNKYCVNISNSSGQKIGYISFCIYPEDRRLNMVGLYIEPKARGCGHSRVFLSLLDKLANDIGYRFQSTAPQKKPLICSTLIKYGFLPRHTNDKRGKIFVGKGINGDCGKTAVFFEDINAGEHFRESVLCKSQNCTVVSSIEQIHGAVQVVLGMSYIRQD